MDFALSREHKALKREIADFARRELSPGAAQRDRAGLFPRQLWRRCGELRLPGLPVPEEHGGRGLDALATALALEGLGYGCRDGGLVFSLGAHLLACVVPLWRFGSDAQKRRHLPGLCSGERVGCFAMTEPDAGSDAYSLTTRAEPDGDGYRVSGSKTLITNAPVADLFLVSARTDPAAEGQAGVSAFLIEAGTPGLEVGAPLDKLGLKTSPLAAVYLRDVRLPAAALLGRPGGAAMVFQEAMDWERTCLFAAHLGTMEWLLETAAGHLRRRRTAAGAAQAAAHRLADLKVHLESARLLVYRAAWQLGRGRSATFAAAMAKLAVSEGLVRTAAEAFHAGAGELPEEITRALRDAAGCTLYSGTSEIQRNLIAGMMGL